jgi:two-component system sensor histidine kinase DctS
VLGLSIALFAVVLLLARDVRRRAAGRARAGRGAGLSQGDGRLADHRPARARPDGRVTYANPAFCAMVGFTPTNCCTRRCRRTGRRSSSAVPAAPGRAAGRPPRSPQQREGFETVFMRKNGERFPVMIYEAPLVDGQGRHTGWMSAVLDMSAQRRMEELSRQQQDRLQATARLATVGEMASLLSHELNQPLAAIASYATGSLNLLDEPDAGHPGPCCARRWNASPSRPNGPAASSRACTTSCAGANSCARAIGTDLLIDAVLPLVRLQARKSGTRIELDLPRQTAARGVRPHDARAGAAQPDAQRHPGDGKDRHALESAC